MRIRLLVSYIAVTLIVVLMLGVPLGLVFARGERAELESGVRRDALALSIRAQSLISTDDVAGLARLADEYEDATDARVVIVDGAGTVLADSNPTINGDTNFTGREEIDAALGGEEADGIRTSETLGTDLYYVAVPVVRDGQIIGAVRITYPLSYIDDRVLRSWLTIAGVGVLVLVVVALVSLVLARAVTRPVADLSRAADDLGRGDLSARVPVPQSPPELRDLAASFNRTAGRIEALVGAQRAFVADASHQLRTPLQALRLRLENLESEIDGPAREDVAGALTEVQRLARLVDGLLVLARAERPDAVVEAQDLAVLVEERAHAWRAFAEEREVRLVTDVEPATVVARAGSLEQVFDNVLANAFEATPTGSSVTILARRTPDGAEVRVRDQGPGISDEVRDRAFDRFWRGGRSDGRGSGLGLAIVQELVRADGGDVSLASAPGGGLDVVITLRSSGALA